MPRAFIRSNTGTQVLNGYKILSRSEAKFQKVTKYLETNNPEVALESDGEINLNPKCSSTDVALQCGHTMVSVMSIAGRWVYILCLVLYKSMADLRSNCNSKGNFAATFGPTSRLIFNRITYPLSYVNDYHYNVCTMVSIRQIPTRRTLTSGCPAQSARDRFVSMKQVSVFLS